MLFEWRWPLLHTFVFISAKSAFLSIYSQIEWSLSIFYFHTPLHVFLSLTPPVVIVSYFRVFLFFSCKKREQTPSNTIFATTNQLNAHCYKEHVITNGKPRKLNAKSLEYISNHSSYKMVAVDWWIVAGAQLEKHQIDNRPIRLIVMASLNFMFGVFFYSLVFFKSVEYKNLLKMALLINIYRMPEQYRIRNKTLYENKLSVYVWFWSKLPIS